MVRTQETELEIQLIEMKVLLAHALTSADHMKLQIFKLETENAKLRHERHDSSAVRARDRGFSVEEDENEDKSDSSETATEATDEQEEEENDRRKRAKNHGARVQLEATPNHSVSRPASRGLIRPTSRGLIRPSSRGLIRPTSRNQIRPITGGLI